MAFGLALGLPYFIQKLVGGGGFGPISSNFNILLESGDDLLAENGDFLITEAG